MHFEFVLATTELPDELCRLAFGPSPTGEAAEVGGAGLTAASTGSFAAAVLLVLKL